MIKFLHAADLHLDSPFASLPPQQAGERRAEQRALLTEIVELCNRERCDLLLLSGDLFDSDNAYQDTIDALVRALRTCSARVFIAPGNHDFYSPGSPYATAQWPENVHIFRNPAIESVVIPELGCEVYGAAFTGANAPSLLNGFRVRDDGLLNLMVLHGDATQPDSPYNAVTRSQIADSNLDYLALGHIHALQTPEPVGKTTYAWPGCPMGRGFDETGEKGVLLGTLRSAQCDLTFVPMDAKRYEILSVEAGDDPLAAIDAAMPAHAENLILRVKLTGEADEIDVPVLHAALSPRVYSLTIRDNTTPKRDLWADLEGDTLRALFLRELKSELDAPDADAELVNLAARFGLDVMDGREVAEP